MNRYIIVLILFILSVVKLQASPLPVSVTSESAILINPDTGAILFEKQARQPRYPASTTKLATVLYALKIGKNRLDKVVAAPQECVGSVTEEAKRKSGYKLPSYYLVTDSCHMGIKRGEEFTLKELLFGTMIVSADDAANIVAYELGGGNINKFMEEVNSYLQSIGCKDTYFNNPHGLHHPEHVTTAYDLALVAKEALKEPLLLEMCKAPRFQRPKTNKQSPTMLLQTNRLMRGGEFYYPKALGLKTGWHSKAGHALVAAAKDGPRTLVAVLLNAKDKKTTFREAILLFETAFNQPKVEKILFKKGPQKFERPVEENGESLQTYTASDLALEFYPAEEPSFRCFIKWEVPSLPIKAGQQVGEVQVKTKEDKILKAVPLLAQKDLVETWEGKIRKAFLGSKYSILWWGAVLVVLYMLKRALF